MIRNLVSAFLYIPLERAIIKPQPNTTGELVAESPLKKKETLIPDLDNASVGKSKDSYLRVVFLLTNFFKH